MFVYSVVFVSLYIVFLYSGKAPKFSNENPSVVHDKATTTKSNASSTESSQTNQRISNQQNSANAQQKREDIRLTKMMLIIFLSFVVILYYRVRSSVYDTR